MLSVRSLSLSVAVLDDDPEAASLAGNVFLRLGWDVEIFVRSEPLLERMTMRRFDAYLLDWRLGEGTAEPVLEAVRRLPGGEVIPVVVLSGNLSFDDRPADSRMADVLKRNQAPLRRKPYPIGRIAREFEGVIEARNAA